jgi:hypothetical protein
MHGGRDRPRPLSSSVHNTLIEFQTEYTAISNLLWLGVSVLLAAVLSSSVTIRKVRL